MSRQTSFFSDLSVTAVFAGFITFLIGISVSSVLVIQAAQILGATEAQISSWFWALGLSIGFSGLVLSWKFKYPVATSWSTAGLALIIATGSGYSINQAIGAFLISGVLTALLGFLGIFDKLLKYLPQSLTSAMLAGVLLQFGIAIFTSMQTDFNLILLLLTIYFVSKKVLPRYCIVITLIFGLIITPYFVEFELPAVQLSWTVPVWVNPEFHWSNIVGLALPLFVINMASQYLPGLAMIKSYGFKPNVNQLVGWTGITQALFAPFGAFATNIAAISAAVCLDDQSHPDQNKRYIAGMACGLFYILMGIFAATLTSILISFPQVFMIALAGIALFATISHNIAIAFKDENNRDAVLVTFLFTASGIQFFGIGSAFWGLLFGYLIYLLFKVKQ